ncbi:MAG: GAF domain-containing protein [Symploca sp. SIO2C1]|nr:GAF domain-containing protein [Symploca sp. SIO2C1]
MSKKQGFWSNDNLTSKLIAQLSILLSQQVFIQLITTIIFPLLEAFLINKLTGNDDQTATNDLAIVLALIVVIHLLLAFIQLFSKFTMPILVQELGKKNENLHLELEQKSKETNNLANNQNTLIKALGAVNFNLIQLNNLNPSMPVEEHLEEILKPWIDGRNEIFNFKSNSLYNLVVYLFDGEENKLILKARSCDGRIIRQDRSWCEGEGYVGTSFQSGRTVFWKNAYFQTIPVRSARPEDDEYYTSGIGVPIYCHGTVIGTVVVTSSEPAQFDLELHGQTMLTMLSYVLGDVLMSLNAVPSRE